MFKHGLSGTKEYKLWKTMRLKCYGSNINNRYKGEHLWICVEWKDDPVTFYNWARANGYEEGLELVRIDKNEGYYPENCFFLPKKETKKTHGLRYSRLYNIWSLMNQRCTNPKLSYYERYGGRGIQVCEGWKTFELFAEWAMKNGYKDDLSIDRIDPNGNYEPINCKWSTNIEQARNTRKSHYVTINGESKTISEWAEISGLPYKTLQRRVYTGCKEEHLLAPIGYQHNLIEIDGVKKTMNMWAKEAGLPFSTIKRRYEKGIRGKKLLARGYLSNKSNEIEQLELDLGMQNLFQI